MCKTLEEQIGSISDVTLYRYLYTHDDSSTQRAIAIRCHHNPNEALRDYLLYSLASRGQAGRNLRQYRRRQTKTHP